jgi:hypothetical protein
MSNTLCVQRHFSGYGVWTGTVRAYSSGRFVIEYIDPTNSQAEPEEWVETRKQVAKHLSRGCKTTIDAAIDAWLLSLNLRQAGEDESRFNKVQAIPSQDGPHEAADAEPAQVGGKKTLASPSNETSTPSKAAAATVEPAGQNPAARELFEPTTALTLPSHATQPGEAIPQIKETFTDQGDFIRGDTGTERGGLSLYDQQRQERIRENNAMMAQLGITATAQSFNALTAKPNHGASPEGLSHRRRTIGVFGPARQSARQRKEPVAFTFDDLDKATGMLDGGNDLAGGGKKRKQAAGSATGASSRRPRPRGRLPVLTQEERDAVAGASLGWLTGLQAFLLDAHLHARWFGRVASATNVERVMAQVRKLASGNGVDHPRSDATFMRGRPLDLASNVPSLIDEAWEWLNEYGADLGNGWLLNHPLKKVHIYQQHLASLQVGNLLAVQ